MFWKQLFATKSLKTLLDEVHGEHRLRRALGPIALTASGVGAIIGAGIFVMTGQVAAEYSGPAVVISFVVAGIGCLFAALCYAEFAALAPVAGSAYTYAYTTLGEVFAWIIGWNLVLEYAMACSCVASSWSKYLNELLKTTFDTQLPAVLCNDPFSHQGAWFNLPSLLITLVVTIILVRGIRESATTNSILVGVKLGVVLFVIFAGLAFINRSNWFDLPVHETKAQSEETLGLLGTLGLARWLTPLDDSVRNSFMPFGLSGIVFGAAMVFFAYIGFDAVSTQAEEARRPQRDVPLAILASLILCTILYICVAAVITGMVPYSEIDTEAAVAAAFRQKSALVQSPVHRGLLRAASGIISVGALAGMTSVLLISFLGQVRIFLAMARDGLLPPSIFAKVHPRFQTPHRSTMLVGVVIALTAALTPIRVLEKMVNIGTLMAFVIVCAAVLVLRVREPHIERPFRTPLLFLFGPLGILVNLTMMLFLPWGTWGAALLWMAAGLVIYFGYGWRHSYIGMRLRGRIPALASSSADGLAEKHPLANSTDAIQKPQDQMYKKT
jgi:APA family basic amino acid/polyamine antiporter